MRAIERSEILGLGDYEMVRPHFRPRVIAEKKPRRVELGEHIAAVFENRDSVLLQIQEMLRTERITAEPAILHEIATYNELIPAAGQLSVTMFVQIPDRALRDRLLAEWAGLEDALAVEVDGVVFAARGPRPPGWMAERTTAVHYLKATLDANAVAAIVGGTARVALVIDHPRVSLRTELGRATLQKLAEDLTTG